MSEKLSCDDQIMRAVKSKYMYKGLHLKFFQTLR